MSSVLRSTGITTHLKLKLKLKLKGNKSIHTAALFGTRQLKLSRRILTSSDCRRIPIQGRNILRHQLTQKERSEILRPSSNCYSSKSAVVVEPSFRTLRWVYFTTGLPFVGFGFMDNAILIIAGDAIDTSLGVALGISTLCAAAIGNIISDLAGIGAGAYIENFCATVLKLPVPKLNSAQRQLRSVRMASTAGMAAGMTIGCVLGMVPLLFIDSNKADKLRKKARLEKLFQDILNEAKTLVGAESAYLYLRVDKDEESKINSNDNNNYNTKHRRGEDFGILHDYHPSVNGGYLYAMYYVESHHQHSESSPTKAIMKAISGGEVSNQSSAPSNENNGTIGNVERNNDNSMVEATIITPPPIPSVSRSRVIPVGKGIVSRAILTGSTWNIVGSLIDEPDFCPLEIETADGCTNADHGNFRDIVVVPILDGQGRVIAVLEALHKKYVNSGFSDDDVEILSSLASHVSVSLQTIYQDSEDEDLRLRDTIRILKNGRGIQRSRTERGGSCNNDNEEHGSCSGDDKDDFSPNNINNRNITAKSKKRLFPD
mmetsp:Transcript_11959/g.13058  ORF Transcript_11959/g.13058 Transcript_11959/m.13058 type:complete len:544 (+) Transcript_11959:200-1831(+)